MTERKEKKSFDISSMSSSRTSLDYDVLDDKSDDDDKSKKVQTSSPTVLTDDQCTTQIIKILDIDDDSCESKMLAKQLMIKGRQALTKFENDIAPNVYNIEMNKAGSKLLTLLKQHTAQEWHSNTEEWLQTFLAQQKSISPTLYEQILIRTTEQGPKYLKDNSALSLVIQFLFEFDDEAMETETALFHVVWKTLISEGLQSLEKFSEDLPRIVITQQLERNTSPLSLLYETIFVTH
jgi:hypothetical protein